MEFSVFIVPLKHIQTIESQISRPLGLHYNHYVSPVSENVHNPWTKWYILSYFAYICMSTFPSNWHANPPVFDRDGFAEQLSS